MDKVETLHAFEQIKLLSDSRRLHILRLLMAAPASLTQLARTLGQSPAWVRHHILALEAAELIELARFALPARLRRSSTAPKRAPSCYRN